MKLAIAIFSSVSLQGPVNITVILTTDVCHGLGMGWKRISREETE